MFAGSSSGGPRGAADRVKATAFFRRVPNPKDRSRTSSPARLRRRRQFDPRATRDRRLARGPARSLAWPPTTRTPRLGLLSNRRGLGKPQPGSPPAVCSRVPGTRGATHRPHAVSDREVPFVYAQARRVTRRHRSRGRDHRNDCRRRRIGSAFHVQLRRAGNNVRVFSRWRARDVVLEPAELQQSRSWRPHGGCHEPFTVPLAPPTNSALPVISGTVQEGSTLSTTDGSWTGDPAFTYQWQDCSNGSCSNITGATDSTYKLQASDVGDNISVVVTGTNDGGIAKAAANPVGPVTAPPPPPPTASFAYSPSSPATGLPVIFDGSASTCAATPCSYAWNDKPPSGGVYPLGSGQTTSFTFQHVGTKYVHLTITDGQGRTADVEHDVTVGSPPPPLPSPPSNAAKPTISAGAQQGSQLTANHGTWTGTAPISYAYQWQNRNPLCSNISGATGSTYTPVAGDVGDTLDVVVTASNSAGNASATSAQTTAVTGAPPPLAPSNTAKPTISGTMQQGSQLTMDKGTWMGTAPISYAYQWRNCDPSCSDISGATGGTYTPVAGDVGDTLDVVVTASNSAGNASATSAQTTAVTGDSPPPQPATCDLNATPSNFTPKWPPQRAVRRSVSASGNYGTWKGGTSKTLTIAAQSGASPSFCWDLSNTSNLTIDGGHTNYDVTTPGINANCGNTIESSSSNITIKNLAITCNGSNAYCIDDQSNGPVAITGTVFHDMLYPNTASGAVRIVSNNPDPSTTKVNYNLFRDMGADGIDAWNTTIVGNDFYDVTGANPSDPRHTDAIQFGSPGDIIEGNFVYGPCTQGIAAYDGTSGNTIEDNVIVGCSVHSLVTAGDSPSSVVAHNTLPDARFECGSKVGDATSVTQVRDNVLKGGIDTSGIGPTGGTGPVCTPSVDSHNMSCRTSGVRTAAPSSSARPRLSAARVRARSLVMRWPPDRLPSAQQATGSDVGARINLYPRPPGATVKGAVNPKRRLPEQRPHPGTSAGWPIVHTGHRGVSFPAGRLTARPRQGQELNILAMESGRMAYGTWTLIGPGPGFGLIAITRCRY